MSEEKTEDTKLPPTWAERVEQCRQLEAEGRLPFGTVDGMLENWEPS